MKQSKPPQSSQQIIDTTIESPVTDAEAIVVNTHDGFVQMKVKNAQGQQWLSDHVPAGLAVALVAEQTTSAILGCAEGTIENITSNWHTEHIPKCIFH